MRLFVEKLLFLIREKRQYLFLALPIFLILIAIAAYVAVFNEPQQKNIPTPTTIPTQIPEPTEDVFLTPEPTYEPEVEAMLKELNKGEVEFAEGQDAIQRDFPWIDKLPLDNADYFVYFDAESRAFVGLLYPESSSSTPIATQVEQLKAAATHELEDLGIPWQSYPFTWNIKPE